MSNTTPPAVEVGARAKQPSLYTKQLHIRATRCCCFPHGSVDLNGALTANTNITVPSRTARLDDASVLDVTPSCSLPIRLINMLVLKIDVKKDDCIVIKSQLNYQIKFVLYFL